MKSNVRQQALAPHRGETDQHAAPVLRIAPALRTKPPRRELADHAGDVRRRSLRDSPRSPVIEMPAAALQMQHRHQHGVLRAADADPRGDAFATRRASRAEPISMRSDGWRRNSRSEPSTSDFRGDRRRSSGKQPARSVRASFSRRRNGASIRSAAMRPCRRLVLNVHQSNVPKLELAPVSQIGGNALVVCWRRRSGPRPPAGWKSATVRADAVRIGGTRHSAKPPPTTRDP